MEGWRKKNICLQPRGREVSKIDFFLIENERFQNSKSSTKIAFQQNPFYL